MLNPKETIASIALEICYAYWNYACWIQGVHGESVAALSVVSRHQSAISSVTMRCDAPSISRAVSLLPLLVGRGTPIACIQLAGTHQTSITSVRTTNRNPVLEVQCFSIKKVCFPFAASDRKVFDLWVLD